MICPVCKNEISDGSQMCPMCGTTFSGGDAFGQSYGQPQPQQQQFVQPQQDFVQQPQVNQMPYNETQTMPAYQPTSQTAFAPQEEKASVGLAILSFLIPLVGIILFFTKKSDKPKTSKACGIAALVSIILGIIFNVIATFATAGLGQKYGTGDTYSYEDATSSYTQEYDEEDTTASEETTQAPAETTTQAQETTQAASNGNAASTKWSDYTFYYDGKKISLPLSLSDFKSITGYDFKTASDKDKMMNPNYYEGVYFSKGDSQIYVRLVNNGSSPVKYTETTVMGVDCDSYWLKGAELSKFVFAGNLCIDQSATTESVQDILGTCDDVYVGDNNTSDYSYYSLTYDTGKYIYENFDITIVNGKIKEIQVEYFPN